MKSNTPTELGVRGRRRRMVDANSLSAGITEFIDILGFSDKVLRAERFENIGETHRLVARIQSEFDLEATE